MHLFKNKTKDVKQFLQEMKANKTNRSSNHNSLEKSNRSVASSSYSQNPSHTNSIGNLNKQNFQSRRRSMNSVDSRDSNRSINGSTNSNYIRFNAGGNRPYPSPPQPINHIPIYDQPRLINQDNRLITTQTNQYSHNFINPVSQPLIIQHQFSNNLTPYYLNQRQFNSFDQSKSYHNQPFLNFSQPMRSHNFISPPDSYPQGENSYGFSQNSNTTVYEKPQIYQNSSKLYQEHKRIQRKPKQWNYTTQLSNQNVLKNENEKFHKKNHFNNSQQLSNNRYHQRNPFNSQVSNYDYEMQQIREAQPGLSTEKDSPTKISQFFSKNKNCNGHSKQTPIKKITQQNIFEIFESDINETQSQEKVQQTKKQQIDSTKNNCNKQSFLQPSKVELKSLQVQTQIQEKTKKLQVSENQRRKLKRNFHQINDSYLEIDKLFKETSILFNNIQRASNQFNKKVKMNEKYFKYLNQNEKIINPKMQIEQTSRDDQTLKKQNQKNKTNNQHIQRTFKKVNRIQEFDI